MTTIITKGLVTAAVAGGVTVLGAGAASASTVTSHNDESLLSGNQLLAPISVPVNISGNDVTGVENGEEYDYAGESSTGSHEVKYYQDEDGDWYVLESTNDESVLSGNQLVGPIDAPVNISGNSLSGLLSFR